MRKPIIKFENSFGAVYVYRNKDGYKLHWYDRDEDGQLNLVDGEQIYTTKNLMEKINGELETIIDHLIQTATIENERTYVSPNDLYNERLKEVLENWE